MLAKWAGVGYSIFMGKLLHFAKLFFLTLAFGGILISCSRKTQAVFMQDLPELTKSQKNHEWYYFTADNFVKVDLPQNSPSVHETAWTEAVRISGTNESFALVNHLGMLNFSGSDIKLYTDASFFSDVTAENIVVCNGQPVFYLYRSSFFNSDEKKSVAEQTFRPFLVEFNSASKLFYPLVSYENLGLDSGDQISGYFWNGQSWACAAKRTESNRTEFKYFFWEPLIPLTEMNPVLNTQSLFLFRPSDEKEYRELNMPFLFFDAPQELKDLLNSIPDEFSFYIMWKDGSGTSERSYYQAGNGSAPLNAHAAFYRAKLPGEKDTLIALFADGTTYVKRENLAAFRLPLLPPGYVYGDFALSGSYLYVSWEQNTFYKTGRAGFLQVDLDSVFAQLL